MSLREYLNQDYNCAAITQLAVELKKGTPESEMGASSVITEESAQVNMVTSSAYVTAYKSLITQCKHW